MYISAWIAMTGVVICVVLGISSIQLSSLPSQFWNNTDHGPNKKETNKERLFGNTNIRDLKITSAMLWLFCRLACYFASRDLGAAAVRFIMNSNLENIFTAGPGWMHVLDLPGDGTALGCNMPPAGTIGPLFRYSARPNRSLLFTDNKGKSSINYSI